MYKRVLHLNYIELGYLVKNYDPEQASNIIQSEGPDCLNIWEIGVKTYTSFLKLITKKLKFKVRTCYYRS